MSSDTQKCVIYRLRPGAGPEYDRRHAAVWPEVVVALRAQGVRDYSIFRRGDLVISVLRVDPTVGDPDPAQVAAQVAWSESLADLFESITDAAGQPLTAHRVFRLDGADDA
jgi:L-rhamnose mutarotase